MSDTNPNCQKLIPLLDAYFDRELEGDDLDAVEKHLPECDDCRQRLIEIESLVGSLKSLPRMKLKRDLADDLESILGIAPQSEPGSVNEPGSVMEPVSGKEPSSVMEPVSGKEPNVVHLDRALSGKKSLLLRTPVFLRLAAAAAAVVLVFVAGRSLTTSPSSVVANKNDRRNEPSPTERSHVIEPLVADNKKMPVNEEPKPEPEVDRKAPSERPQVATTADRAAEPKVASKVAKNDLASGSAKIKPQVKKERLENKTTTVASRYEEPVVMQSAGTASPDLIALYDAADTPFTDDLGISTDEDGLYALKL